MVELLDWFKILSDETRMRIIMLLLKQELCVCEMCDILDLSQPMVSRHLSKLKDVGLVTDERKSQWIFYSLNKDDELMKETLGCIERIKSSYPVLTRDEERLIEKMENRKMCERKNK